jgi:hypothetical protein
MTKTSSASVLNFEFWICFGFRISDLRHGMDVEERDNPRRGRYQQGGSLHRRASRPGLAPEAGVGRARVKSPWCWGRIEAHLGRGRYEWRAFDWDRQTATFRGHGRMHTAVERRARQDVPIGSVVVISHAEGLAVFEWE